MALTDYVPGWLRPAENRTETRIADYQQRIERAADHVRRAGGAPDAFAGAMEAAAVKAGGAPPLRPATETADRLSDWEIADRLASSRLKPREVEAMVTSAAAAAIGPQRQADAAKPKPQTANGWTPREAEAMNAHLNAKAARDGQRSEPSNAEYRKAERASDATDPMHDARRERQADAHPAKQAQGIVRTSIQEAAAVYRASLIAAAPQPARSASTEAEKPRRTMRM